MAETLDIKPGLWEVRTLTHMVGMPRSLPPVPVSKRYCVTAEMLAQEQNLPLLSGAQGACETDAETAIRKSAAQWGMTCLFNGRKMQGKGELKRSSPERYRGSVDFNWQEGRLRTTGETSVNGRWLGDCQKYGPQQPL